MTEIELIKKITSYHPAYKAGTSRGWSYYVGGMMDTGNWYYHKLLDATNAELEACLADLIEEDKPAPPLSEENQRKQNRFVYLGNGIFSNEFQVEKMQELLHKMETQMLWGKSK